MSALTAMPWPVLKPCFFVLLRSVVGKAYKSSTTGSRTFRTTIPLDISGHPYSIWSHMWIASVLGFYSVVKKGGPGQWQIRGREKQDLLNLLAAVDLPADRLIVSRNTDYAYRIIVDAAELGRVFTALVQTITYPNFKSEIRSPVLNSARNLPHTIAFGRSWLSLQESPAALDVAESPKRARKRAAVGRSVGSDGGTPGRGAPQ